MRQFMPGQSTGTGPQNPYPPYQYDTSLQPAGTLSFYHPHMHGLVAEQVWGGLAGPIVVQDDTTVLSGLETHLLVLKDLTVSYGTPAPYTSTMQYMQGMEGNTVMVNGQVNPVLSAKPGQVQRWRILNASQARFYKLSLANHTLQVVGTDGGLLNKPYPQSYILLAPGERVDVLIKASSTPGTYKFLSLPYSRMGMMTSAQITLMTLSVSGTAVNNTIPGIINSSAKRIDPNSVMISDQKALTLSMMGGRGYINGFDFDVKPYVGNSIPGTYEIWTVVNQSNMDHPWHQHTNHGQVLSISGGDAAYAQLYTQSPARKDVVIVPQGGTVKMLVPVMDYSGMAMFHCHILEHEDIGMIAIWQIGSGM
jgi:FtsP/CotA-like multicopper oxidase with cupredoxin domain